MGHGIVKKLFCIVIMVAFLTGCADSVQREESITANNTDEMENVSSESEETAVKSVPCTEAVEVSDKNAIINYSGENFIKSAFAAGGNMLYICGMKEDDSYFSGYMQAEEDVIHEFDPGMDEDMRAFNMAVDCNGRCHILWMSVEKAELNGQLLDRINYGKSCITVVNSGGELEKEVDVSGIFSSRQTRPFCFAVDREGNYYIENEKEIIQILPDGAQGRTVACDGRIEGIGVGKSGAVYCIYEEEGGGKKLADLNQDGLSICDAKLPEANASYAGIYAGTDSEILLFNKDSGIFAYDGNEIEARVSGGEMPVTNDRIAGYGILSDGRACILSQENGTTVFYYVPAGK